MRKRWAAAVWLAGLLCLAGEAHAFDRVEPTAEQKAYCDKIPPQAKLLCLDAYSVRGLEFPGEPVTAAEASRGGMAVYRPADQGVFPAIVMMHTCADLATNTQLVEWSRLALAKGYVVFILDSFAQRGIAGDEGCDGEAGRLMHKVRLRDAFEALSHLSRQPFVDRSRIALMGFSQGGRMAYLAAADNLPRLFGGPLQFAAVVSVYGQCFSPTANLSFVPPKVATPLLALLGSDDSDGNPAECLPRLKQAQAAGAPVEWHVFEGVGHLWDQPDRQPGRKVKFSEPPFWVLMQYDGEATRRSHELAFDFLQRVMR